METTVIVSEELIDKRKAAKLKQEAESLDHRDVAAVDA